MKLISHIKQLVTLAHLFFLPLALSAQNGITISNFAAAPGTGDAPTTLTFNIKWTPPTDDPAKVWSDTVWVFIDYNNKGTMTRLPLATGATLTNPSWEDAEVIEVDGNPYGVWVVGNARSAKSGAFSATVRAGFKPAPSANSPTRPLHGACIYAINYPPRAQYTDDGNIKLNGTPPFYLTFAEGAATVSAKDAQGSYTYPPTGKQLLSLTDASLAPGSVPQCKTPAQQTLQSSAQTYCAGSGVTFALSGTEASADYRLINEGTDSATTLTGTGSAATFTGTFTAGTYHVETAHGAFCPATLTSQVTVTVTPPGGAGQNATCGCQDGTSACSGTCYTNKNTYQDRCTGCKEHSYYTYNVCGIQIGYELRADTDCWSYSRCCQTTTTTPSGAATSSNCAAACSSLGGVLNWYNESAGTCGCYVKCQD